MTTQECRHQRVLSDQSTMLGLMDDLSQHANMDLATDVDRLRQGGWLYACVPVDAGGLGLTYDGVSLEVALDFLGRLGSANLSLGRLFEGHANACKLVASLANQRQKDDVWAKVRGGALLGVWGADSTAPVTLTSVAHCDRLSGEKSFCSGLGLVSIAIISAQSNNGLQLIIADVTEEARGDPAQWQLSGMQATRSGTYLFECLAPTNFSLLGAPNVYYDEPHFSGGQWRYLALHAGAVAAIGQEVSDHLHRLSRDVSDAELMRLARIVGLGQQCFLWAKALAIETERVSNPDAGTQAILGRELVEQACLEAITLAERVIGTQAFKSGSRIERLCRDLRTYLRQAALDQRLIFAGKTLLAQGRDGQQFLSNFGVLTCYDSACP